jgi:hypothetical protein
MVKVIASNNDAIEMFDIVETGIVAAGANLANATLLRSRYNVLGTVAAGADGVKLPANMKEGYEIFVRNTDADAATVYPNSATGKINGGADGAGVTVAQNATLRLVCAGDDLWWAF